MNDENRKLLTEYLEECWHEISVNHVWDEPKFCLKCNAMVSWTFSPVVSANEPQFPIAVNRPFTTPDDMMALKEKLVETGEWDEFLERGTRALPADMFLCDNVPRQYYSGDMINWLINAPRFCELAIEWLRKEGKG